MDVGFPPVRPDRRGDEHGDLRPFPRFLRRLRYPGPDRRKGGIAKSISPRDDPGLEEGIIVEGIKPLGYPIFCVRSEVDGEVSDAEVILQRREEFLRGLKILS